MTYDFALVCNHIFIYICPISSFKIFLIFPLRRGDDFLLGHYIHLFHILQKRPFLYVQLFFSGLLNGITARYLIKLSSAPFKNSCVFLLILAQKIGNLPALMVELQQSWVFFFFFS
jgi:hypothetical protein